MSGPTESRSDETFRHLFERGPRAAEPAQRDEVLSTVKENVRRAVVELGDEERCAARLKRAW